jgi:hypothetical protein
MKQNTKKISVRGAVVLLLLILNAVILKVAFIENSKWYLLLIVTLPLLITALYYKGQKKQMNLDANLTKRKKATCSNIQYMN